MGVKEMLIEFDNPWSIYYAGGTVRGQFMLNLDAPKKVRDIHMKIKGEAQVRWDEQETIRDSDTTEIQAGRYVYPFQMILPNNLPSSYEGEFGHVRYTVKAVLNRPWKFDQEAKSAFTVISPLDLNYEPKAQLPIDLRSNKSVGVCCCKSGPLSLVVQAPASGFVSGQTIPLTVEVENMTNCNVPKVQCLLRKTVTYKATHPSMRTKIDRAMISEITLSAVGAHSSNTWHSQITVPALPPSNLNHCSIIDVIYELRVEAKVTGMFKRGLHVKTPVIFGTVPLARFHNQMPPVEAVQAVETSPKSEHPSGIGWFTHHEQPPAQPAYPSPSYPQQPSGFTFNPNIPPPSYEESVFGKASTIRDEDDNDHTMGLKGWTPRYPTYNFAPSAPPPPQ